MIAMLLTALFGAGGLTALVSIIASVRRHAPTATALRDQLRDCPDFREACFQIDEVRVRRSGIVLTPDFTPVERRPAARGGLRAAA